MKKPIRLLSLAIALASTALQAQDSPIPATVMVATDDLAAKDFTVWAEDDISQYAGNYSGDVGGDSSGKLTLKVNKAKKDESPVSASGSYSVAAAGSKPTVVSFQNASYWGEPRGVISVGPFNLVFVNMGKIKGVIVGNVFLPKQ